MTLPINDISAFRQYIATSGQTVFAVPFEFFEDADLFVYQDSALLTLDTDYTVTGAGVAGGGAITLTTGATSGDPVTIIRDVAVKRVTDFPLSGPFQIEALNTELDRHTAMIGQNETRIHQRVIRLADFDRPSTLSDLPGWQERANKILGFTAEGDVTIVEGIRTDLGMIDDGVWLAADSVTDDASWTEPFTDIVDDGVYA